MNRAPPLRKPQGTGETQVGSKVEVEKRKENERKRKTVKNNIKNNINNKRNRKTLTSLTPTAEAWTKATIWTKDSAKLNGKYLKNPLDDRLERTTDMHWATITAYLPRSQSERSKHCRSQLSSGQPPVISWWWFVDGDFHTGLWLSWLSVSAIPYSRQSIAVLYTADPLGTCVGASTKTNGIDPIEHVRQFSPYDKNQWAQGCKHHRLELVKVDLLWQKT